MSLTLDDICLIDSDLSLNIIIFTIFCCGLIYRLLSEKKSGKEFKLRSEIAKKMLETQTLENSKKIGPSN